MPSGSSLRSSRAIATPPTQPEVIAARRRASKLADWLDTRYQLPGTPIRFGYDAILGLIPVIGDSATTIIGALILIEARRLGVRKPVLAKMIFNLVIDWLIGLIPLVDLLFDVAYKANLRNARLLEAELAPHAPA